MNLHMFKRFYTKPNQPAVATIAGPLNPPILGDFETGLARKSPSIGGLGGDFETDLARKSPNIRRLGGLLTLLLTISATSPVLASPDMTIGQQQYNQGQYKEAIVTWTSLLNHTPSENDRLLLHRNLAQAHKQLGQTDSAIDQWQALITLAEKQRLVPLLGLALTEQAQAYSAIGRTRTALKLLCNLNDKNKCAPNSALALATTPQAQAAALGSLGDTHRLLGEYDRAQTYLQQALKLAQTQQNKPYQLSALNSLGNNALSLSQRYQRRSASLSRQGETPAAATQQTQAEAQTAIAKTYFQQSLTLATSLNSPPDQLKAQLSLLNLDPSTANLKIPQLLTQLPPSRDRIYSTLDFARHSPNPQPLLQEAISLAQGIQDQRSESFALGSLGKWHEQQGNIPAALKLTQDAILAADRAQAKDSRYQWEWQMARLLRRQNQIPGAITAYQQSIATMEGIRADLLSADRALQFDFRDSVEPIYRELIDLQFQTATPTSPLTPALTTLNSLRLAELQNYFGSDCLIRASEQAKPNEQDNSTAIVRSIILGDRLVSVLSLPNQPDQFITTTITRQALETEVIAFRQDLETFYNKFRPDRAQKLYHWLIEPFAPQLKTAKITTLVFINDGILRSLPMAALHDGKQFLVENYAIATTPSLSLTNLTPRNTDAPKALAAGVTKASVIDGQQFVGLDNVAAELTSVRSLLPGSQILQDNDFTQVRLGDELAKAQFPIIHMATHGQFGAEVEDTFLVLGNQQKLSLTQLDVLIRKVSKSNELIDLLTLTACKTAIGDDRAALGLAGIAIQAGTKSVVASLWSINDTTTRDFTTTFYQSLKTTDKAKALQAAQIKMIKSNSPAAKPAYWAPYILVGSWR